MLSTISYNFEPLYKGYISRYKCLSEKFISNNKEYIDWDAISQYKKK